MRNENRVPELLAQLLMAAIIPQWIDNDAISTALKIIIILLFYIKIRHGSSTTGYSSFTVAYFISYTINVLIAFFVYGGGLLTVFQSIVIAFITLRLFYDIPQRVDLITEDDVLRFYKLYSYFILVSCVYNLIVNYRSVFAISTWKLYSGVEIKSFFDNKNTFGVFLMFGVLASSILQVREGRKRWFYINLVLLYNELMAMCRTAIIISVIIFFISYIADKTRRLKNIIKFSVLFLFVVYVLNSFNIVHNFFYGSLFGNIESFDSRNHLVSAILPYLRGHVLITGYGSQRGAEIAYLYTGMRYFHNSYLAALVAGGIPRLLLQLSAAFVSLFVSRRIAIIDKTCSNICIMTLIAYLIYGFAESVLLFESPVICMTSTIFVITMPILWLKSLSLQK